MKKIETLVRPAILALQPYSSARDEFKGEASIYLDANENPYPNGYNRYPDPMQWKLKERISELKNIPKENIFLGNGSDEAIDLTIRIFCNPGVDRIVTIAPSYGMYEVASGINDIACLKIPLDSDFQLSSEKLLNIIKALEDNRTKVIFLCSPNNPSGNLLKRSEIINIIKSFEGIVVVDEAYIDFANEPSFIEELDKYSNLIVLQTLSKAWGGAGLRLGMAFASTEIIRLFNKVKYPYNVNGLTQNLALELLNNEQQMKDELAEILQERNKMQMELSTIKSVEKIFSSDANFLLVKIKEADQVYHSLVASGIIVRSRTKVILCDDCIRITIGTPEENKILIEKLKELSL